MERGGYRVSAVLESIEQGNMMNFHQVKDEEPEGKLERERERDGANRGGHRTNISAILSQNLFCLLESEIG